MSDTSKELLPGTVLEGRYTIERRLKPGGASTVYHAKQIGLAMDRAIKVLDPHVADIQLDMFVRTFEREIKILSQITHSNIVKIIDFGKHKLADGTTKHAVEIPYFVMEYISGGTATEFATRLTEPGDLLKIFSDIIDGMVYLHDRYILHSDIKPDNILIAKDDHFAATLEAKVADLGVALLLDDLFDAQMKIPIDVHESTYLWGSPRYAPAYADGILNKTRLVPRAKLKEFFPHYDLHCLGATLAELFSTKKIRTKAAYEVDELLDNPKEIVQRLNESSRLFLKDFIRTLLKDKAHNYASAREARIQFQRVNPIKFASAETPELLPFGAAQVISHNDGLSQYHERIMSLIDHPSFQRLRSLNQLSFIHLIYPDARHTRFSHSLDAYDIAVRVAIHLLNDSTFRQFMGTHEINLFLCTTLLHDLGHYPLAHVIEDLRAMLAASGDGMVKSDAEMLPYFFDLKVDGWDKSMAELLNTQFQIKAKDIQRILDKSVPTADLSGPEALIRGLIDSSIDIDKIAYLISDSKNTGVPYGSGIDVNSLIGAMRCLSPDTHRVDNLQIGLLDKGITAAEGVIISRYQMFSKVYWHHTNRAIMAMAAYTLKRVLEFKAEYGFGEYLAEVQFMGDLQALGHISKKFQEFYGSDSLNPLSGIVDGSRQIYKRLTSFSRHPTNKAVSEIHTYLGESSADVRSRIRKEIIGIIRDYTKEPFDDAEVLLDVPQIKKEWDALAGTMVIDPYSSTGLTELRTLSPIADAVKREFKGLVKKSRVFASPRLRKELRDKELLEPLRKAIITRLHPKAQAAT